MANAPGSRSRRLVASLALATVSVALTLGLVECLLRIVYPIGARTTGLHSERLFALVPSTSSVHLHYPADGGGFRIARVNSQGFRGPELRASERRIAIYGDSFIHAEYASFEETLPAQLEAALRRDGVSAEVVNAGVHAYGPDQALLLMEESLAALNPDLVIFALFAGNDFGDLVRNKLFAVDSEGKLVRRDFRLDEDFEKALEQHPLERLSLAGLLRAAKRGLKVRLRGSAPSPAQGPERALRLCREEISDYASPWVHANVLEDHYDADLALTPDGEGARVKIRLMQAILTRVRESAAARGVPLIALVIPAALDAAPGLNGLAIDRSAFPDYDPRRLSQVAADAARRAGLDVVDLWDRFQTEGPESLYYPRNRHWNPRGQRIAADELRRYLVQSGWPAAEPGGRSAAAVDPGE